MKKEVISYAIYVVCLASFVQTWLFPSWQSTIQFVVLALASYEMWTKTPTAATQTDIDTMKRAVENLATQLNALSGTVNEVKNVQGHIHMRLGLGRKKA